VPPRRETRGRHRGGRHRHRIYHHPAVEPTAAAAATTTATPTGATPPQSPQLPPRPPPSPLSPAPPHGETRGRHRGGRQRHRIWRHLAGEPAAAAAATTTATLTGATPPQSPQLPPRRPPPQLLPAPPRLETCGRHRGGRQRHRIWRRLAVKPAAATAVTTTATLTGATPPQSPQLPLWRPPPRPPLPPQLPQPLFPPSPRRCAARTAAPPRQRRNPWLPRALASPPRGTPWPPPRGPSPPPLPPPQPVLHRQRFVAGVMRGASKHTPHNRHSLAVAAAAALVQTLGRDAGGSKIRCMALWEARSAPKRQRHCRSSPSDSDSLANHRTVLIWPTAPFVLSFLAKEAP